MVDPSCLAQVQNMVLSFWILVLATMANNAQTTTPADAIDVDTVVTEAERAAATADVDEAVQAIAQQSVVRPQAPARGTSRPAFKNDASSR